MPPKNTKGNPVKKEQLAEKVKEIRMRQKNWLRQREDHLNDKSNSSADDYSPVTASNRQQPLTTGIGPKDTSSTSSNRHAADILRVQHDAASDVSSQVSDKLNVRVKHGFGAWLQSRNTQSSDSQEEFTNGNYRNNVEQRVPTEECSLPPSSYSESSQHSSNRSYPLSPEDFDSLADSIASRVKKDLGINGQDRSSVGGRNHHRTDHGEGRVRRSKTFVHDEAERETHPGDFGDGQVDVSSHRCPFCSSLMATAEHAPTLLVPCGHTVCKLCATSHPLCRLCGTKVASLTTNIMLQQIIHEFLRKNPGKASLQGSRHPPSSGAAGQPKATAVQRDVNYSSQLRSLRERQTAMQEEAASRQRERDRVSTKVKRAEKQLAGIQREEGSLMEELRLVQQKLQNLQHHKEEYAGECRQLQEEERRASDSLVLVEKTLKSLEEEVDKVQFLAEGQVDMHAKRRIDTR